MPFWLQLVTAVSAGAGAAILGVALVPYLQKLRFFPPQEPSETPEAAGEEHKPIMGGLLLLAGTAFSFILSIALYWQFGDADRTSAAFSEQVLLVRGAGVYALSMCIIGGISDVLLIRQRYHHAFWDNVLLPLILLAGILGTAWGLTPEVQTANHWLVLLPVPAALCFIWEFDLERDTDGALISVNAVELLVLTVMFLKKSFDLPALLTLAAAGACLGSMIWCLHPAKCRIGRTGTYLLGSLVPMLCLLNEWYRELALLMAVFALQQLYRLRRRKNQYLTQAMQEGGIEPLPRIAILTAIAAFCGVMALLLK